MVARCMIKKNLIIVMTIDALAVLTNIIIVKLLLCVPFAGRGDLNDQNGSARSHTFTFYFRSFETTWMFDRRLRVLLSDGGFFLCRLTLAYSWSYFSLGFVRPAQSPFFSPVTIVDSRKRKRERSFSGLKLKNILALYSSGSHNSNFFLLRRRAARRFVFLAPPSPP